MSAPVLEIPLPQQHVEATPEAFAAYKEQARTWDADKIASAKKDVRYARGVSLLACAMTVLATMGAVAAYQRPVPPPAIVMVEEATGTPTVVPPAFLPAMSVPERHARHMLWTYVQAREGWSWGEDDENFRKVILMTAPNLQKSFERWWKSAEGHREQLRAEGVKNVIPISIELDGPEGRWGGARVRYRVDTMAKRGGDAVKTWHSSRVDFVWSTGQIRVNDALVNPFGFVVTNYRRDPETPQE